MHMSLEIICLKVEKNQHPTNHCPIFLYRVFQFAQPFNKFQAIFIILLDKNKTMPKNYHFQNLFESRITGESPVCRCNQFNSKQYIKIELPHRHDSPCVCVCRFIAPNTTLHALQIMWKCKLKSEANSHSEHAIKIEKEEKMTK